MAFSLGNFVKNQTDEVKRTLSPTNIIDKVTPGQVKSLVKADPKKFLDNKLGDLSGVKLGQTFKSVGAKFKDTVLNTIEGLAGALEAQVVGCLNHAIRGILNKNPVLEKIIFFEQFVNKELSLLRNKLESKIDSQLRKIAYNKLKIHQTVLFRQRMLTRIKKVCPGATPASPGQIRQYREIVKSIANTNKDTGNVVDEKENFPEQEVNNKVESVSTLKQTATRDQDVSNKVKKASKEDPDAFEKLKNETVEGAKQEIEKQSIKQIKGQNNNTWQDLTNECNE